MHDHHYTMRAHQQIKLTASVELIRRNSLRIRPIFFFIGLEHYGQRGTLPTTGTRLTSRKFIFLFPPLLQILKRIDIQVKDLVDNEAEHKTFN